MSSKDRDLAIEQLRDKVRLDGALTVDQLEQIVRDSIENTVPADIIMEVLVANDGKRFDKRIVDKIKAAFVSHGLPLQETGKFGYNIYSLSEAGCGSFLPGHTDLYWYPPGGCGASAGDQELIRIASVGKGATIDAAWIRKNNGRYYAAAQKRNEHRRSVLLGETSLRGVVDTFNGFLAARRQLDATIDLLEEDGFPEYWVLRKLTFKTPYGRD